AWPEAGIARAATAATAHFQIFMPIPSVTIAEREPEGARADYACSEVAIDVAEEADVSDPARVGEIMCESIDAEATHIRADMGIDLAIARQSMLRRAELVIGIAHARIVPADPCVAGHAR